MTDQTRMPCPKCSGDRKKVTDRCLTTNGTLFFCHHCGHSGKYIEGQMVAYNQPSQNIPTDLPDKVIKYFEDRGITKNVLIRNRIGYRDRQILFPYFEKGKIVNIKYRTHNKKFRQEKGCKKVFYGLDDINGGTEAIIVEGEMDKLALEVAGYKNVLSIPDGAPSIHAINYETKFNFIQNAEYILEKLTKIIIAVDTDAPGIRLKDELIRRLGPERSFIVHYPIDCKDVNDVLVKYGAENLALAIEGATPAPIEGLFEVSEFSDKLGQLYNEGLPGGVSTGYPSLDTFYTVRKGEMTVITGIPFHGKSTFQTHLMYNLARNHGWCFGVFSPENLPLERYIAILCQMYVGKPFGQGFVGRMTIGEMKEAESWVKDHFTFIFPPENELTIKNILNKATVAVRRYGISGLVIDPWNELDHSRPSRVSETEHISGCLTRIRRFARAYSVHVWVVAHPAKMQKGIDGGYGVPTPYDISGSAHFRNRADNCISVWRNELDESKATAIHVQKVRFREVGKAGKAELMYNYKSGGFV